MKRKILDMEFYIALIVQSAFIKQKYHLTTKKLRKLWRGKNQKKKKKNLKQK